MYDDVLDTYRKLGAKLEPIDVPADILQLTNTLSFILDVESSASFDDITRSGDIRSPRITNKEPLRIECEHFVEAIRTGTKPRSDGEAGLRVVRVLAALQESLRR